MTTTTTGAQGFSDAVTLGPPISLDPLPPAASLAFPRGFEVGVSTSAYQTEGDNRASDLWEWERTKGWERSGAASRSWDRWEEDLRLAAALGLRAYRFSVEWGRVVPAEGRVDGAALERYAAIVERCRALGMRPIVCLHHFTHPRWLLEAHPRLWEEAALVDRFVEWARLCAGALPQVRDWVPFNEPNVYLATGYLVGAFPPGVRRILGPARAFLLGPARHVALAHRRTFALLKQRDPANQVGVAQNLAICAPLVPGRDDAAARGWDRVMHWALLDALVRGKIDADLDGVPESDIDAGGCALDWLGVNYYTRAFVRSVPLVLRPARAAPIYSDLTHQMPRLLPAYRWLTRGRADREEDDMAREQVPEGLTACLEAAWRRYRLPMIVTENGVADASGRLRARALAAHLEAVRRAIAAGCDVRGFLYWSLLDNYEWGSFRPRFGLHRVDYANGCARTLTEGGRYLGEVARAQPPAG